MAGRWETQSRIVTSLSFRSRYPFSSSIAASNHCAPAAPLLVGGQEMDVFSLPILDIFSLPILTAIIIMIISISFYKIRIREEGRNNSAPHPSPVSSPDGGSPNVRSPDGGSASEPADDGRDGEPERPFEVFLSFRGEIRNSFVSHLYRALKKHNIRAFMDRPDLNKGEPIEKLLKIIEESKIMLPIFSKGYAQSVWCLKEITKMAEMRETGKGRIMIPIFLDARTEEVRNWCNDSQSAFATGDASVDEKEKWNQALQTACTLSAFHLKNHANGDEGELVELIVKDLDAKLPKTPSIDIAEYPIGLECRVQEVMNLLKSEERDVKMIVLQGMSGIGKTTIAKAVYDKLRNDFNGASTFVSDVAKKFRKGEDVKCQVDQLIHDVSTSSEGPCVSLGSIDDGKCMIKEKRKCRKVLIVLDDIDDRKQLQALAGSRDRFGAGSVIIITSKAGDVLSKHLERSLIYEPRLLDGQESLQLFVRHAFKGRQPTTEEYDLSRQIAETAGGLPIALEVLGPHFFALGGDTEEWRSELKKLKDIPHHDIEEKLKFSYDGLEGTAQEIFLDIACFFVGEDFGRAAQCYWEARGFHPEGTIKLLQRRFFISMDMGNRFRMHDLLRNMGREIVLQRRIKDVPSWARTRLWTKNDIFELLSSGNDVPSCATEAMMLNQGDEEWKEPFDSGECFRNMHNLRLLHIEGAIFKNNFHRFPMKLLWLGLPRCSFDSPQISGLHLKNLVILNLSNCNLASLSLFEGTVFENMKVLDLSSTDLTETPDFCNFPCLEELTLRKCEKLTEVHSSIGKLGSLLILDMRTCTLLERLPDTICKLGSIEVIHLEWCEKFSSLPEEIGDLTSLKVLSLNHSAIRKIPDSMVQLTSIHELSLQHCRRLEALPDSLIGWLSSGKLKMFGTPLKMADGIDLSDRPHVMRVSTCELLANLPDKYCRVIEELHLEDPMVQELPHSIRRLQNLVVLSLKCEQLRALPAWINGRQLEKLKVLEIESNSLESLPKSIESLEGLKTLKLVCQNLQSLPGSVEKLKSLEIFEVTSGNLERLPSWIGSLRSLRYLKVECSRARAIPKSIKQLEELEILELKFNNPNALPTSTTLPKKLKKFTLSCRELENLLDSLWSSGELEELSLRGCARIEAVPGAKLRQLNNLLHLDLSQTGVKEIPGDIYCLPKLRSLRITDDAGNDTCFWFE
ncbi:unnamed protein product [Victoria cruziana]